jgi:hypothetical protein
MPNVSRYSRRNAQPKGHMMINDYWQPKELRKTNLAKSKG